MASETKTTLDVPSDFNPSSVEGVSVPPIPKRLGVSDSRKFCRRAGNPFNVDYTNDREMLNSNTGVKITRSGYYSVSFCSDFTTTDAIKEHRLLVNGEVRRQVGVSALGSRNYVPGSALLYLNSGELLALGIAGGTVNNTTATFIEVLEIS